MFTIETKQLLLREFKTSDLEDLHEIFDDAETMQYYSSTKNRYETRKWINWNIENYTQHGFGLWAVLLKKEEVFIGDCGITIQDIDGEKKPEIGYHIHKKYWNQGLATEAAIACRDHGFQELNLDELFVKTNVKNKPSIRVAEKTGMKFWKEYCSKSRPGEKSYAYSLNQIDWLKIKT